MVDVIELSRYRQHRRAALAARRAMERWPGVHGQVLRDEIASGLTVLPWLGPSSRVIKLIDQILDEDTPSSSDGQRGHREKKGTKCY